ncbi:MAG: glycosyltransferase family 4 protein [Candidatus Thermoplasmatota archaeon]
MKIALTSDYFHPSTGGAEQSALELSKALSKKGHEVVVFTRPKEGEVEEEEIEGVKVRRIFEDLKRFTFRSDVLFPRIADKREKDRLIEEIKGENFDILHSNNRDTAVFTAETAGKLGLPGITHVRDYWLKCPKRDFMRPDGICPEPKRCSICMADYYNKWYNIPFYWKFVKDTIYRYEKIKENTDYYLYNSSYVKEKIGLSPGEVIYNPVNIQKTQKGESKDGKILYIGNITERKGVKTIVEAVKGLDIELHLIGDGYLLNNIDRENIIKHGRLEYDEVLKHLYDSEMMVVPSSWPEPFGRVAVEGMAAGLPIIVTNSGGLPEVVNNCGIIVKREDPEELRNKIIELHQNKELREELSKKGLQRSKLFSPSEIADQTIQVYRRLVK